MKIEDSEGIGGWEGPLIPNCCSKGVLASVAIRDDPTLVAEMRTEKSFEMDSQIQRTMNPSMSEQLLTSMEDICTCERNKPIPVSDFLRNFRENGAHFISSAYL